MGLYLGKKKLCSYDEKQITQNSMKMFFDAGCNFNGITATSVDGWFLPSDTADVVKFGSFFYNAKYLKSAPSFDMSKATDASSMFLGCSSLVSVGNISAPLCTDAGMLFYNCSSLKNIGSLGFSEKLTLCSGMFYYCKVLTSIPLFNSSKVTSFDQAFYFCRALTEFPLLNFSSCKSLSYCFYYCDNLKAIPALDLSAVTSYHNAFYYCTALEGFHATGMKASFSLAQSTNLSENAIVEILNNLASVSSTQTLTLGSTNLAKLTDEEKAIATGKGWTLA